MEHFFRIIVPFIPFFIFAFWSLLAKILLNLCLHIARQDGQDGKKIMQIKWPKTKRQNNYQRKISLDWQIKRFLRCTLYQFGQPTLVYLYWCLPLYLFQGRQKVAKKGRSSPRLVLSHLKIYRQLKTNRLFPGFCLWWCEPSFRLFSKLVEPGTKSRWRVFFKHQCS